MTRSLALVFAATLLVVGACAVDDDALGTAKLALTGQSPSGTHYRLRHADLTIAGPGVMQDFHTEDAPDQPTISTHLPAGSYTLALAPAWSLERVNADGTAVTVDATLLSANPLPFDVSAGALTPVVLRFQAGADQISMGDGDVDITIGVDDPPTMPPTIITSVPSLTVTEGSTAAIAVHLSSPPAAAFTVAVATTSPAIAVAPAVLTFTPSNFALPQVITVTAVQDPDANPAAATIALTSPGSPTSVVAVQVIDDDVATPPAIVVDATSVSLVEGSTFALPVHLSSPPAGSLVVQITSSDSSVAVASPSTLVFDGASWNVPQIVNVTGVQDGDLLNEGATLVLQSPGAAMSTIAVNVLDDDAQKLVVTPASLDLNEGATAVVQVVLAFQPAGATTVTLSSSDPSRLAISPSTLTFTPANWSLPRVATVSALVDPDTTNNTATITASAAGVAPFVIPVSVHEAP